MAGRRGGSLGDQSLHGRQVERPTEWQPGRVERGADGECREVRLQIQVSSGCRGNSLLYACLVCDHQQSGRCSSAVFGVVEQQQWVQGAGKEASSKSANLFSTEEQAEAYH